MGGWRQPVIASNRVFALWRTKIFDSNSVFALLPYRGSMKHYVDKTNPPSLGLLRELKIVLQYLESQKKILLLQYPSWLLCYLPLVAPNQIFYMFFSEALIGNSAVGVRQS